VIANADLVKLLASAFGPLALVLAALPFGGLPLGVQPMAAQELALPCPSSAGWQVVRQIELPRVNRGGRALGGFSAAIYKPKPDQLWLLSDLPQGSLSIWDLALAGLAKGKELALPLAPPRELPLRGGADAALPAAIDAEAMVLLGDQLWVASEGRRSAERSPQLLKFAASTGELLQAIALPAAWQAAKDSGLASNGGPESLTLLPGRHGRPQMLMAAEHPLLQDPARQQRLLSDAQVELLASGLSATPDALRRLPSASYADAPVDARQASYPVLVMSHAAGGASPQYTRVPSGCAR
jgi:hypothetical protein